MAHRLPQRIVEILEDALSSAKMERASFDMGEKGFTIIYDWQRKEGSEGTHHPEGMTEFIKEKTRLYRQSWIVHRIEEILEWSQSVDDGSMNEYDILGQLRSKWPNPVVLEKAAKEIEGLRSRNAELEDFRRKVASMLPESDQ